VLRRRLASFSRSRFGIAVLAVALPTIAALAWWLVPRLVATALPVGAAGIATLVFARVIATYGDNPGLSDRVARWSMAAFVVHLAIGVAISSSFRLTTYLGGDAVQYHLWAQGIIAHWSDGAPLPFDLPIGKAGYPYLVAAIYWVFGAYQVAGLALNAFLAACLIPLMTDTTRRLYGDGAAHWIAPIVLLPVGFLLWPSQLLREAGIMFLIAVALNGAVRLEKRTRLSTFVMIGVAIALLFTVRNYMAVTLGAGLLAGIVLGRRGIGGLGAGAGAVLLVGLMVVGLGVGSSGLTAVQQQADLSRLNNIRQGSATGAASGFLAEADISTGRRAVLYLPIALPRFFLGPFPWEIRPGRQLLALPDVMVWWALLPSLWRGFRRAWLKTRRGIFLLVMPTAAVTGVLALLVANYGTVVRARMQVLLLLAPLIALGLELRRSARTERGSPRVGLALSGAAVPSSR
jgi:hypothetical protein